MTKGVVMDFGIWRGGWGWVHASPASLRAWGHDPCVLASLCRPPGTMGHVVGACKVSPCGYGGWGSIFGWPGRFDAGCCTKPLASRRGHVTGSVFARGTPFTLEAGMGVKGGTSGHVVSLWGVVPRMRRPVLGTGGLVVRRW